MAKKEDKALMVPANKETLALLTEEFGTDSSFNRILLPRLGLISQDVTEGKGKNMKVVTEAGTFVLDVQTEEVDEETGKKLWKKTELGTEIEGIILFRRKQLRYYDEDTEEYTSSPIYDTDEDIVPLFCNKKEVARGTPKELRARPEFKYEKDGKVKSALEENRILYVLYENEEGERKVHQMNLRGTSMFAFMDYAKKHIPPTVLTRFSSEPQEKGSIQWNQMTFEAVRPITQAEAEEVIGHVKAMKDGIALEKSYFEAEAKANKDF